MAHKIETGTGSSHVIVTRWNEFVLLRCQVDISEGTTLNTFIYLQLNGLALTVPFHYNQKSQDQ